MSHGKDSLDMMPKTQATKVKIDKLTTKFFKNSVHQRTQ